MELALVGDARDSVPEDVLGIRVAPEFIQQTSEVQPRRSEVRVEPKGGPVVFLRERVPALVLVQHRQVQVWTRQVEGGALRGDELPYGPLGRPALRGIEPIGRHGREHTRRLDADGAHRIAEQRGDERHALVGRNALEAGHGSGPHRGVGVPRALDAHRKARGPVAPEDVQCRRAHDRGL